MRFGFFQAGAVQHRPGERVFLQRPRLRDRRGQRRLGAVALDPPGPAEEALGAGGLRERFVFDDGPLDHRQHRAGGIRQPPRAGVAPVVEQPPPEFRQVERIVARIDPAVEAVADQRAEAARKGIGDDARALDQAGVAVTGLGGDAGAVDEQDLPAARLQMERRGHAHDPCAEHHDVDLHARSLHAFAALRHGSGIHRQVLPANGKTVLARAGGREWAGRRQVMTERTILAYGDSNTWGCVPMTGPATPTVSRWRSAGRRSPRHGSERASG